MLSDALARRIPANPLAAGCMIGSSLDGLDVALLRFGPEVEFVGGASWPLRNADPERLRRIAEGGACSAAEIGALRSALALDHVAAIRDSLRQHELAVQSLDFVGAHGVTLSHRPNGEIPHSWQLLDGEALAARLRCVVVCDFRSADVALGGQGAPLAPLVDAHRRSADEDRAILNLGGIMNVSLLSADAEQPPIFADVGPANLPLDCLWRWSGRAGRFDEGGAVAAQGRVDEDCCEAVLAEAWVRAPLPRSFGREEFGDRWTEQLQERMRGLGLADQLRTVVEIEARSLAIFVEQLAGDWRGRSDRPLRILLTGGGRHHGALAAAITECVQNAGVEAIETIGIDGDLKEAMDFAWLAWMRLTHRAAPESLARAHLGAIHFPVE